MPAVPQDRPQQPGGAYVDAGGQLWVYDFATGRYEPQQAQSAPAFGDGLGWYANGGLDPRLSPQATGRAAAPAPAPAPAAPAGTPAGAALPSGGGVDPAILSELSALEAQLGGGFDPTAYGSAPAGGGYAPPPMPTPGMAPPGIPNFPNGQAWGQPASAPQQGSPSGGGPLARGPGGVAAGQGQAVGPDGQRANPGYASANGVMATPGMVDARRPESSVGMPGGAAGGSSSGGGGSGKDAYWDVRNNLLGGNSSDYGSYDAGPTRAQYRRADRRYEQDQRALQREWDLRAQFQGVLGNSAYALPTAFPGMPSSSLGYQEYAQMPAAMLALVSEGAAGKDRFGTDPKRFQRTVADLYRDMEAKAGAVGFEDLMGNLMGAKKGSALGHMFMEQQPGKVVTDKNDLYKRTKPGQWKWGSVDQQHDVFLGALGAIGQQTLAPGEAAAQMLTAQGLADKWASRNLGKRNPGSIQRFMRRKLDY